MIDFSDSSFMENPYPQLKELRQAGKPVWDEKSGMFLAATYADAISFGDGDVEKTLIDQFSKVKGKKVIPYNQDSDLTEYLQLYGDLANK